MRALAATATLLLALTVVGEASAARAISIARPRVEALPSSGRAGAPVRLRVFARTDAPALCFIAWIYRGNRQPVTVRTDFIRTVPSERLRWYYVVWQRPPATRGTYPFCIKAFDRGGRQSNFSCAPVRIY